MAKKVITRFPPSPTGFLHIGGARTALFNWLYAKAHGGDMVLRIEDTDRARSTQQAVDAIIDGLTWLGLDWQGEPVSQASRADRHIEVAKQLLARGRAYYCHCTKEELETMREKAREEKRPIRYDGTCRDRKTPSNPDVAPVLRFKAVQEGETIVDDQVQGPVRYANKELDDLILLRSDGSPTYNLSVVVDDHDMGITHILRGVDHLTNAARQIQIYQALDWDVPVMAHIPLIHGEDGAKLSKRHGALGVDAYREMGFLPAALRNYLARLGWAHGDDEIFSTEQAIKWFDFGGIGKSPARFDFTKLGNLNGHYIRSMPKDDLAKVFFDTLPFLPGGEAFTSRLTPDHKAVLIGALPVLADRAKTLVDLMESAQFIVADLPLTLTEKAASVLEKGGRDVLLPLHSSLAAVANWDKEDLEAAIKTFGEENDLKMGKIAPPLRVALTGTTVAPGIYDLLLILGRDESLRRLKAMAQGE